MAIVLTVEHHNPVMIRARHLMKDAGLEVVVAASTEEMLALCGKQKAAVAIVEEKPAAVAEALAASLKGLRQAPKVLLLSDQPPWSGMADAHMYVPATAEEVFGEVAALLSGG